MPQAEAFFGDAMVQFIVKDGSARARHSCPDWHPGARSPPRPKLGANPLIRTYNCSCMWWLDLKCTALLDLKHKACLRCSRLDGGYYIATIVLVILSWWVQDNLTI